MLTFLLLIGSISDSSQVIELGGDSEGRVSEPGLICETEVSNESGGFISDVLNSDHCEKEWKSSSVEYAAPTGGGNVIGVSAPAFEFESVSWSEEEENPSSRAARSASGVSLATCVSSLPLSVVEAYVLIPFHLTDPLS